MRDVQNREGREGGALSDESHNRARLPYPAASPRRARPRGLRMRASAGRRQGAMTVGKGGRPGEHRAAGDVRRGGEGPGADGGAGCEGGGAAAGAERGPGTRRSEGLRQRRRPAPAPPRPALAVICGLSGTARPPHLSSPAHNAAPAASPAPSPPPTPRHGRARRVCPFAASAHAAAATGADARRRCTSPQRAAETGASSRGRCAGREFTRPPVPPPVIYSRRQEGAAAARSRRPRSRAGPGKREWRQRGGALPGAAYAGRRRGHEALLLRAGRRGLSAAAVTRLRSSR